VSALVTWDDEYLGVVGPFAVDVPWWVEVEPVGIEPSERIYHLGGPAASVRAALKSRLRPPASPRPGTE
jgi:hypothetical protein